MKHSLQAIGCGLVMAAVLGSFVSESQAQTKRFFGSIEIGPAFATGGDFEQFLPRLDPAVPGTAFDLDTGLHFGMNAGYFFTDWVALELETGPYAYAIDGFEGTRDVLTHDSYLVTTPFLLNLRFETPNDHGFIPFAGVGFGGVASTLEADYMRDDVGAFLDGTSTDFGFAYQGFAGFRYALSEFTSLGLTYRFFATEGVEWDVDGIYGRDVIELDALRSHSVSFSFTASF